VQPGSDAGVVAAASVAGALLIEFIHPSLAHPGVENLTKKMKRVQQIGGLRVRVNPKP